MEIARMTEMSGGHLESREVAAYLDRALRPADRERVESHLADCPDCRREVIEVSRIRHAPGRRLRWLIAVPAAAAAAAVVILMLARSGEGPSPEGPILRDGGIGSAARVVLVSPTTDRVVDPSVLTFTWRSAGEGVSYRLALTDATGDVVWTASASDTTARLPATVRLKSGSSYHWYVDALLTDGRSIASAVQRFTVQ